MSTFIGILLFNQYLDNKLQIWILSQIWLSLMPPECSLSKNISHEQETHTEELHNAQRHTSHNKRKHNEIYDKNLFRSKKIRQNMAICLILFFKAAI